VAEYLNLFSSTRPRLSKRHILPNCRFAIIPRSPIKIETKWVSSFNRTVTRIQRFDLVHYSKTWGQLNLQTSLCSVKASFLVKSRKMPIEVIIFDGIQSRP
jgi:hypothetical protein